MSNKNLLYNRRRAFGVLDVLVLAGLMGMFAINVYVYVDYTEKRERDALRLAHIERLEEALNYFYQQHNRYPGVEDGISEQGEVLGSGSTLDSLLYPIFSSSAPPSDPLFHASQSAYEPNGFYYAYDPSFADCSPVISINNFETLEAAERVLASGGREVFTDADLNIATADFNKCLRP